MSSECLLSAWIAQSTLSSSSKNTNFPPEHYPFRAWGAVLWTLLISAPSSGEEHVAHAWPIIAAHVLKSMSGLSYKT